MGIDFSKFSNGFKALFYAAIADKQITADEFQRFSAADQAELSRQLAGSAGQIGDIIVIQKSYEAKDGSILNIYAGTTDENGTINVLDSVKNRYPDAGDKASFNNGVLTLQDKQGNVLLDALGNPVKIDFTTGMEIDSNIENTQGAFEVIEGEDFQRTNRRFTIALIKTMYNRAIISNAQELEPLGLLDARTWREIAGEGIQLLADSISKEQEAITATTMKRVERLKEERDIVVQRLEKALENPASFSDEFSKLLGCSYQSMKMEELRTICMDEKSEKDNEVRYTKTVEGFNKLYPDNKISKYLDGTNVTQSLDKVVKFCDGFADILVMLLTTGEISTVNKSLDIVKLFLKNVAKKDYKAAIAMFPKLSTFLKGSVHSATTMSTFEGGKAFINSATNGEKLTLKEILSRTVNGFLSGAEMGVEMSALQTFAIGPIMNKLTPVLNKMTGATSKVSALLSKNGSASMEEISKIYDECIQTTRGTIAKEGLHLGVSLPVMVSGFTTIDSAKSFLSQDGFDEEQFRAQLKAKATSDDERERISKMDSIDLKIEFVRQNFNAQFGGMTTIEGVSLIMRRYQAARLAGQAVPKPINNLLGAKINTVEKDGKTLYEVVAKNEKTLKFDFGNDKKVSKFSSPERAIAAYQALCLKTIQATQETEMPKAQETAKNKGKTKVGESEQTEYRNSQESAILSKLKTANDRETFVAIRDEINKMPAGKEKTQLMKEYLKKYNKWSASPERPNIRMQYMPEGNSEYKANNILDKPNNVAKITLENIDTSLVNVENFNNTFNKSTLFTITGGQKPQSNIGNRIGASKIKQLQSEVYLLCNQAQAPSQIESVIDRLNLIVTNANDINVLKNLAKNKLNELRQNIHFSASGMFNLAASYKSTADDITSSIARNFGLAVTDSRTYSSRIKGDGNLASLENKIERELRNTQQKELYNAVITGDNRTAMTRIYDMYGARFNVDTQADIDRVYNELVNSIKEGKVKPTYIANYYGEGATPIFSESQMKELQKLTDNMNLGTVYHTAVREDGYIGLNFSADLPSCEGLPMELQVRTKALDLIANNVSHYSYDVFNNKDILTLFDYSKQKVLKPLVDTFKLINADSKLKIRYNKYMTECYRLAQENIQEFPSATQYSLPEIVSVKSILDIDKILHSK